MVYRLTAVEARVRGGVDSITQSRVLKQTRAVVFSCAVAMSEGRDVPRLVGGR